MPGREIAASTARRIADSVGDYVAVDWLDFQAWFAEAWKPGQHTALIGPTGEGKSTFAVGVLEARRWVLALDPKGGDETLGESGYETITSWPLSSRVWDRIAEGQPVKLIVGGSIKTDEEMAKLIAVMRDAVKGVRAQGGWTLYADEFQLLADRRMYGLDKEVEAMLIAARSRGTSVLTSFQATAWVPKAATRQASWVVIWPTRDEDMIKSVASTMGRSWRELKAAVRELPPYHVIVIPKRVQAPMVITTAPKL